MIGNTNIKTFNEVKYVSNYDKKYINDNIYKVKVVDYDGSIIDQQNLNNNNEYTLPTPPTHDGLTFQEWSCTQQITNNKIIINDNNVMIGAVYTTVSGKNEFDIELNDKIGLNITFNMNGTKDWGDGTSDTNNNHTYQNYGQYTIKCNGQTYTSSSGSGLFGQSSSNINYSVKHIKLANITLTRSYAFQDCYNLESIIISNNVSYIAGNSFLDCHAIKTVIIPSSISTIDSYAFQNCHNLINLVMSYNITTIKDAAFRSCYSLRNLVIPGNVTTIGTSAFADCYHINNIIIPNGVAQLDRTFSGCYSLINVKILGNTTMYLMTFYYLYAIKKIDFTSCQSIPTLYNVNVFMGMNKLCKIIVPQSLLSSWKSATNWVTYKDYIYSSPAIINFNVISGNPNIYVNNKMITDYTFEWWSSNITYSAYDANTNTILPNKQINNIISGSTYNIDIDPSTASVITLHIGVSGLNVTFTINNKTYLPTENNGDYYIKVISDGGDTLNYFIDGGDNYFNYSGTINTTGNDITENITLTPATPSTWTRPNLSSNGTIGGSYFAVSAEAYSTSTNYQAWRAVDSDVSTSYYWFSKSSGNREYIFYNPDAIKVSELTYKYTSTTYKGTDVTIQGSNDNINWVNIESTYNDNSNTCVSTITNPKYYKYYKLTFTPYSNYIRLYDMLITAVIKT